MSLPDQCAHSSSESRPGRNSRRSRDLPIPGWNRGVAFGNSVIRPLYVGDYKVFSAPSAVCVLHNNIRMCPKSRFASLRSPLRQCPKGNICPGTGIPPSALKRVFDRNSRFSPLFAWHFSEDLKIRHQIPCTLKTRFDGSLFEGPFGQSRKSSQQLSFRVVLRAQRRVLGDIP
jgi:hypothetical protein